MEVQLSLRLLSRLVDSILLAWALVDVHGRSRCVSGAWSPFLSRQESDQGLPHPNYTPGLTMQPL